MDLVKIFPNEMITELWADILRQEGIKSMIKPQLGGYGPWGHDSFIPHGLYVSDDNAKRAKEIMAEANEELPTDGPGTNEEPRR